MRRIIWIGGFLIVVLLLAMQLRRPNYDLSPVNRAATFEARVHPDAQIGKTLQQSCYSCHSAQGEIPWYGHVWPTSQLLQNDVRRARARLDFSNWSNLSPEMSRIRLLDACQEMRDSRMPLWYYRPMHPGSAPKSADIEAFCGWAQSLPAGQEVSLLR
jgi:Haem-binding domain